MLEMTLKLPEGLTRLWFYWQSVLDEKQRDLADLQGLRYQ
jgi:hypothetical protein